MLGIPDKEKEEKDKCNSRLVVLGFWRCLAEIDLYADFQPRHSQAPELARVLFNKEKE